VWPLGPGSRARASISRKRHAEARARPGHERVAVDAMPARSPHEAKRNAGRWCREGHQPGFRFAPSGLRVFPIHHVKQPSFFTPGSFCVRVLFLPFHLRRCRPPVRGIGGAPRDVQPCRCRASNARRHACEAWALPRNREARLTALRRGVVGPGPASVPVSGSGAKAPRHPTFSAGLRCRAFRVRGYQPRSTPHPAPPSGSPRESAPRERDVHVLFHSPNEVNNTFITYS
jgi:hypothetical protein